MHLLSPTRPHRSFIRRVLNKSRTRNSLGQRLVVVSCVFFRGFYSLFCPICLMCETVYKTIFIVLFFKQKHFRNDFWGSNNIRRRIESGTISRLCLVFLIEAVVLRTIWCNLKEASIATKQNSKITQRISYWKYGN